MNKFWIVSVMLLSAHLVTSGSVNADDALIKVEILTSPEGKVNSKRRLRTSGIEIGHGWSFENKTYTALIAIDSQLYNKIRSQNHKRRYDFKHFPPMVDQGTESLQKLIRKFNRVMSQMGIREPEKKVNFVLAFVHAIPWTDDETTGYDEFYKYPIETLAEGKGDCEDTSMLFASILSGLGFEVALIDLPRHIAVGVKGDFRRGEFVTYENDKYFFCETTSAPYKLGDINPKYVGMSVNIAPITAKPIKPKRVVLPSLNPPELPSAHANLEKGITLFYAARYNEAITILQSVVHSAESSKQRAEAYLYLGCAMYGFGEGSKKAKTQFQKALRQNPSLQIPRIENHDRFGPWLKEVRKASVGDLTITASLPEIEIWLDGNGIDRKTLGTGTFSLFKGNYTVEVIYEGESIEKQHVKINPDSNVEIVPPPIVKHESISEVSVGELVYLTSDVMSYKKPERVQVYYTTYDEDKQEIGRGNVKMRLSDRRTTSLTWVYEGRLAQLKHAGSIQYYMEVEYRNRRVVRNPIKQYSYHRISVVDDVLPFDNKPPKIVLSETIQTAKVNRSIVIKAAVTDENAVKWVHLMYGFSRFRDRKPSQYEPTVLSKDKSDIYTGYIPSQSTSGYIWYYLIAEDESGNTSQYPQTNQTPLKIEVEVSHEPVHRPIRPHDQDPETGPGERQEATNGPESQPHKGFWITGLFDGVSTLNLNNLDALSVAFLREGKTHYTLSSQLDFNYQVPVDWRFTIQGGPALGKSRFVLTGLVGGVEYSLPDSDRFRTLILGASAKYYLLDNVTIEATGSLKPFPSTFDTTPIYHYDLGVRIYIRRFLSLKVGYGEWYLGNRDIKRVQIGVGYTF